MHLRSGLALACALFCAPAAQPAGQAQQAATCAPFQPETENRIENRRQAAAASPNDLGAQIELARCYDQAWRFNDAVQTVEYAISLFRSEPHAAPAARPASDVALAGVDVALPARVKTDAGRYPDAASTEGIGGIVVVETFIDKEGRVRRATVAHSIRQLDSAAVDAVKKWRFAPAVLNGKVVEVLTYLPIKFGQSPSMWASDYLELAHFFAGRQLWAHVDGALSQARAVAVKDADRFEGMVDSLRVPVPPGFAWPKPVNQQVPRYTSAAMQKKVQGQVELRILVDRMGEVARVVVIRPLPMLTVAAELAAQGWRFAPATIKGQPVPAIANLVLEFRLH